MNRQPRYLHDCGQCQFLGQYTPASEGTRRPKPQDLYIHVRATLARTELIVRESSEGPDYQSMPVLGFLNHRYHPGYDEPFEEALALAQAAGLVKVPPKRGPDYEVVEFNERGKPLRVRFHDGTETTHVRNLMLRRGQEVWEVPGTRRTDEVMRVAGLSEYDIELCREVRDQADGRGGAVAQSAWPRGCGKVICVGVFTD